MEIWPAIDLLAGQPVRLLQGQYDQVTGYGANPRALAERLRDQGLARIHLVDLSGAKSGSFSAWDCLSDLVAMGFHVEVGGGFRQHDPVARALGAGAIRVVVGTQLIRDVPFADRLLQDFGPEQIVVGIDVRAGRARLGGWLETGPEALPLWQTLFKRGFTQVNVTDIDRDGSLEGLSPAFWQSWAAMPGLVGAGGGISTTADLALLEQMGLQRAVIGKAWIEGRISLPPDHPPQGAC